ncbi:hypothetical protein DPEC_G00297330 [Dallia pectoralis]|uniref:Uncharacterized protein n=1 Tax=Dallia pectoralis TaxID=75939 RepID=A0ACC2FFP3_DALPE|nr:hypothetical protein DPEC_G00297330 [Dallia pectoralis]
MSWDNVAEIAQSQLGRQALLRASEPAEALTGKTESSSSVTAVGGGRSQRTGNAGAPACRHVGPETLAVET